MYNYRITTFLILTSVFWTVEMAFAVIIWLGLSYIINTDQPVKEERPEDDPPRGRSRSRPEEPTTPLEPHGPATEADVEDEGNNETVVPGESERLHTDSGIGTSMESGASRPLPLRRRDSRPLKKEEDAD